MSSTKTKHGYEVCQADQWHKYRRIFCKDNDSAIEDIRELLEDGQPLECVNAYDTFYGCAWGDWLIKNTKDFATAEVAETWNPGGYCGKQFPRAILLTPIKK